MRGYQLGNPLEDGTNLGPMVRTSAADFVYGLISEAVAAGARMLVAPEDSPGHREGTPYLGPALLADVNHNMSLPHGSAAARPTGRLKYSTSPPGSDRQLRIA